MVQGPNADHVLWPLGFLQSWQTWSHALLFTAKVIMLEDLSAKKTTCSRIKTLWNTVKLVLSLQSASDLDRVPGCFYSIANYFSPILQVLPFPGRALVDVFTWSWELLSTPLN